MSQTSHMVSTGLSHLSPDPSPLERDLVAAVDGEVRFDAGSRGAYSTDASNYRRVPAGVVVPRTVEAGVAAVDVCRRHGATITSRGGGTSLAGQTCGDGVIIDWSKYCNRILDIDPERRTARVEPGVVLDDLRSAAAEHGLTFGPDPATHDRCTLGGMIGNNSCGVHAVMAGRTADNVEALEVLCYDGTRITVGATDDTELDRIIAAGGRRGEIYARLRALRDAHADAIRGRFPRIPRRVSGYNLDELLPERGFHVGRALVGTEGTCVTLLTATLRLVPNPAARALLVLGFDDVYAAGDAVPDVLRHGPIGLEGIDSELVGFMDREHLKLPDVAMLPEGRGWLLAEFGGDAPAEAESTARRCAAGLEREPGGPRTKLIDDPAEAERIWAVRESGLGATARVPGQPDAWPGWEDSAVPPDRVGDYLRDLRGLYARHGYQASVYGHFGDGCIHTRIPFDLQSAAGLDDYRRFIDEASDLVASYGGSFSGEHGDGQARGTLLDKMFGRDLVDAMRAFRRIWDPHGTMNPGKVVDADPITDDLRLGTDYNPLPLRGSTHFAYPDDDGDFARATTRCVGIGLCRRTDGGTMCPSYMVTREEEHSTRGRARLLFEMLQGDSPASGWDNDAVLDSLDLCLSCKGCKGDCPVNVDMATYKAEFLAHHYKGKLRPRAAYALGLIPWASRLAARLPDVTNAVLGAPLLGTLLRRAAGVSEQREAPRFARETFTAWFARAHRPLDSAGHRGEVLLWPDTFTEYFRPEVGRATVEVLERCGWSVRLPPQGLCCGRPLYDYGMLTLAKRQLRQIVDVLRDDIRAGTQLVGMEPSCLVTFRDELGELFPADRDALRLRDQSVMLTELLAAHADDLAWGTDAATTPGTDAATAPGTDRRAVVHGHCHQEATIGMAADLDVLSRIGVEARLLDSGCCGMAGSFGFEAGNEEVSEACAERALLPAAREAVARDELVVSSGFSCREQVRQLSDVPTVHTHELLRAAFAGEPVRFVPEGVAPSEAPGALRANAAAVAGVTALATAGAAVAALARRR